MLSFFCKNLKDITFLKPRYFVTKNFSLVVTYGIRPTFQDSFSQPYFLEFDTQTKILLKLLNPFLTSGIAFVPYETMQVIMYF